jgi:uncharacterized protein YjiS (DUF1127 family)
MLSLVLAAIRAALRRLSAWFSAILARRAITPLLYANERMLRDIGLNHDDIVDCLAAPHCADPSQILIARIYERREALRDAEASARLLQRKAGLAVSDVRPQSNAPAPFKAA